MWMKIFGDARGPNQLAAGTGNVLLAAMVGLLRWKQNKRVSWAHFVSEQLHSHMLHFTLFLSPKKRLTSRFNMSNNSVTTTVSSVCVCACVLYNGTWTNITVFNMLLFVFDLLYSGKRWAAMMMRWTPSGHTKCVMSAKSTRITGYAVTLYHERMCCVFTLKWNSRCEIATASQTFQDPAKKRSTSSTMSPTLTRPLRLALSGWRTHTWRWTLSLQTRASQSSTLDVWTQKWEVSGPCPKPGSTWPFRILDPACRSFLWGFITRSVPPPLQTLPSSQRRQPEPRRRPWSLLRELVSRMPWRCQCRWSFIATEMESGWFLLEPAPARPVLNRQWRIASVKVRQFQVCPQPRKPN